jgi:hypothetical protein
MDVKRFDDEGHVCRAGDKPPVFVLASDYDALQAQLAALQRDHAASAARVDARVAAILDQCRPYMQHSDECGDQDSYNNVEPAFRSCGCGLDSLLEALAQPDAARPAGEMT